jgi:hypothetical protein
MHFALGAAVVEVDGDRVAEEAAAGQQPPAFSFQSQRLITPTLILKTT